MEILALMENILRYNGLRGHMTWMTLGSNPAASTCFPCGGIHNGAGDGRHTSTGSFTGLPRLEEPSCHMAY